jgi:hypothetical protein
MVSRPAVAGLVYLLLPVVAATPGRGAAALCEAALTAWRRHRLRPGAARNSGGPSPLVRAAQRLSVGGLCTALCLRSTMRHRLTKQLGPGCWLPGQSARFPARLCLPEGSTDD